MLHIHAHTTTAATKLLPSCCWRPRVSPLSHASLAVSAQIYRQRRLPQCCAAKDDPHPSSSGGDSGQPPNSSSKPAGGGGSSGEGGNSGNLPQRAWPRWYKVWIWATALTYLIWRFKWRRDRRMAAEQFAQEQQQEEDLRQEWYSFAQSYGVKTPPPNSNS